MKIKTERELRASLYILLIFLLAGCSTKRNNFFTRQYHQLTTRYNVYFNGKEAFKAGEKKMEKDHKEDYTNLLPVFVSNNEQTRKLCGSDMDYAIEKAIKAIDKHSITTKPKRKKNKDSKSYETFRKKKEFNNQIAKCYLLLGESYFYKQKYAMANNTFRYLQRQYADDEKLMTEVDLWMFRSLTEMGRYEEAGKLISSLESAKLKRNQREMLQAAKTDFYVRQAAYLEATTSTEQLVSICKSMKRKPRYYFMLSQLYLKDNQEAQATNALKKAVRFNFNYEMVFNAKINMALAYRDGDGGIKKKLQKMIRDPKNEEYLDRIYYALANIEEKQGNVEGAIDLYWKSVKSSVTNDNQKSLSFLKLGDYYYKEKEYIPAQNCYDSCMYFMDSRVEGYDQLKTLVTDLTELVTNLNTIQRQDSLQKFAALPEKDRNNLIDDIIQQVKDDEVRAKEEERKAELERSFFQRNDMMGRNDGYNQSNGGEWYFYNPMTIALGKNEFKRKWGRRKLEDNWRRQNKSMVDFGEAQESIAEVAEEEKGKSDNKSREYYTKDLPLTEEQLVASNKLLEDAYYKAGEVYLYKFDNPGKALECFAAFIERFSQSNNLPFVYYLAYSAAQKVGEQDKAVQYKEDLLRKFPESDFAKGLQDPQYFKKVDSDLHSISRMYQEAYAQYQNVYYNEALAKCEDILAKYPGNKLSGNILFLRAMCMVNVSPEDEAREALNKVLVANPNKEIKEVVNGVLASLGIGDKPVLYADNDMATVRYLKSTRNWVFDEKGNVTGEDANKENPFQVSKDQEQYVMILLPEELKTLSAVQIMGRLTFINAGEAVSGTQYETKKEELWYKKKVYQIGVFKNYDIASEYLNKIATDKLLLKHLANKNYRMFVIDKENLNTLKRVKDMDKYIDFFVANYFDDHRKGEMLTGKMGTSAHIFNTGDSEPHDCIVMLPFRKINVKKIAELLYSIERAFALEKESYDDDNEFIVIKNVGDKQQALEYIKLIEKNNDLYERLAGIEHRVFAITQNNLQVLVENKNIEEYMKFFDDNYMKNVNGEIGVEEGNFIYNKSVGHEFIVFYSNKIDPFKLKAGFDEINFAGLSTSNCKYDDEHDCLVVSGFANKEEAMRYFRTAVNNRKLFKVLKNTDYRNFIISDTNFGVLKEKQQVDQYLGFFKKYYINN